MPEITCPYCKATLPADARGCPTCAWNREAEVQIDRVLFRGILPATIVVVVLVVVTIIYLAR